MKESLTQLLVHLDGSPRAARRLAVARDIAQTHGAAVTALYAVTPALLVVPFAPEAGPSVAEALGQIDEERRTHARGIFDRSVAAPGVHAAWAEVQDYPIVPAFARQALYADLLVLGQHDPTDTEAAGVPFDFAETVMASSGKPALILPYADIPSTAVGQTIVIAWKPTREAARAVSAAVPLLQRARRVHVLSWGKEEEDVAGRPSRPRWLPQAARRGADLASRGRRARLHGRLAVVPRIRPGRRPDGDGLLWPQPRPRVGSGRHFAHGAAVHDLAGADGALKGRASP